MTYHYYQKEGGEEEWKVIMADNLANVQGSMFITVLSVDTTVSDKPNKEELSALKYKGPLYFDLDDAESPASTSKHAVKLVSKLIDYGVPEAAISLFATGGKGYHITVPEECFIVKPSKSGYKNLPTIYKELAFGMAVDSMDFRVYTARKGRMFRQPNVKRPNGLYKVPMTLDELKTVAKESDSKTAEEMYKTLCSKPRALIPPTNVKLSDALSGLYEGASVKVGKAVGNKSKRKTVALPENLPSFEAMLRGQGLKEGIGFNEMSLQIAVVAHTKGIAKDKLLTLAEGLCQNHQSDGSRYNSYSKRRVEIERMYDYIDDNPCYHYSPTAVKSLLTHHAPDLYGVPTTSEEVQKAIENPPSESEDYQHASIVMTADGAYALSDGAGAKKISALAFENVTELVSPENGTTHVLEVDVTVGGKRVGRTTIETSALSSSAKMNELAMKYGQTFSGNDVQARDMYLRSIELARRDKKRMYVLGREGLDFVKLPFHDDLDLKNGFLVWSDGKGVVLEPRVAEKDLQMKFVGYPTPDGEYRTDLSESPSLAKWLLEGENKEELRKFMHNFLECQAPQYLGKMIGWTIACFYRMLFHNIYSKFPLLHVNGAAGSGKTEGVKLISNFHYFNQEPKMLTPMSSLFAVSFACAGSSSIPLILDEFKPSEMSQIAYDKFKLMLRDAYNCRSVEKGGGTRENQDYRSVHRVQLSAPMCFIAEAAENESALMERVVLLTLVKPAVVDAQRYFGKFMQAVEKRQYLGILGKYISAQVVKKYSIEDLKAEFDPVYAKTRKELMLQDGEELGADNQHKAGAKERTVFNYSVVKFGLIKFKNLLHSIFDTEFDEVLNSMIDKAVSTVIDIQNHTIPEWLKVLNSFADMARLDPALGYALKDNKDYAIYQLEGTNVIEFYARGCYFKYRHYTAIARSKPLFPTEQAFVHALEHLTALVKKNVPGVLNVPGGSHILNLQELRSQGFTPPTK